MELTQITNEIHDSAKRLEKGSKEIFPLAKEMAETERDYRRALQMEIVNLRTSGMSVTLIPDIARGNVAELKYKRDLAEAKFNSAKDSLRAIQAGLSGLQTILKWQTES